MKLEEIVTKLKQMSPDVEICIGQAHNDKYWLAIEPGWVIENDHFTSHCGYGDTVEEAANDYVNFCKGKSFQFEPEEKEPYEVAFSF